MPYIATEDRKRFENLVKSMHLTDIRCAGDLNYLITHLVHAFFSMEDKINYQKYNDAVGALEGAKLELYRRFVGPYENTKIESNGDVP
jgi:hypothetical protein